MFACPSCGHETPVGAIDEIAEWLHAGVHDQMAGQVENVGGWPSEVERLVYQSLDTALALFAAYLDKIDADADAAEKVH